MSVNAWSKPDPLGNFFSLPNQIYSLGLEAVEIAVYDYLRSLKNRESYQCWPSYKTIGKAVGMSKNTVKKYVVCEVFPLSEIAPPKQRKDFQNHFSLF